MLREIKEAEKATAKFSTRTHALDDFTQKVLSLPLAPYIILLNGKYVTSALQSSCLVKGTETL